MASIYRAQIETLIGALRVVPPDRYRWFGERSHKLPHAMAMRIDEETRRRVLVTQVQSRLYRQFYLPGTAVPASHSSASVPVPEESLFARALVDANQGTGNWQSGWAVIEQSKDGVWARRAGLSAWFGPDAYRNEAGSPLAPHGSVAVRMPKDLPAQSPGFYLAQSDAPLYLSADDVLVRLYWHLCADGAPSFMASVTSRLNAEGVPFNVKVLNDPGAYHRNDAGVVYLTRQDLRRAAHLLMRVYEDVRHTLQPGVPALTKPLAGGLSLAEDPRNGESFGMHRCRSLAEAVVEAAEQQITDPNDLLDAIENRLRRAGIDPSRPYLNPNSIDDYDELLGPLPSTFAATRPERSSNDDGAQPEKYLKLAEEIGTRLVQNAIWYDDRCTWLGNVEARSAGRSAGHVETFGAIGPDLYAGTSGIALFLAHLFAETGIEAYRITAQGAMTQAIRTIDRLTEPGSLGFYTGVPGIAVTAATVGVLLGDHELAALIPTRLAGSLSTVTHTSVPDLLSGTAGAVVALLALSRMLENEQLLTIAIRYGDRLLATAKRRGKALCWPVNSPSGRRGLTGLAHGSSGIGFALLELFVATQDERFRLAAEAAFAFERRSFSPALENWVDLRYPSEGSPFGPAAVAASVWCHGSGGIAISRLAAWNVLGDPAYLTEARVAIEATRRWTELHLDAFARNWSLCHGLAGNAVILWRAARWLPDESASLQRLALRVANAGLATVAAAGDLTALCATDEPGLLLGLPGTGHFYLSLANSAIPSVLVPGD